MNENKPPTDQDWADPDDAPDLSSPEWMARLAATPVARGRPKAAATKASITIRLDEDVLTYFKAGGDGWQTRINAALRECVRRGL